MRPLTKVPNADINEPRDWAIGAKIGWRRDVTSVHEKWWIPFVNFSSTPLPLLYSTPPPPPPPRLHHLLHHWFIKQGSELMTFLANNKWSGKIGTLLAASSDCQGGPVRFQRWQDGLTSRTVLFIFLSFSPHCSPRTSTRWNQYLRTPQTHKWSSPSIRFCLLDWKIYCFLPLTPWLCLIWERRAPKDEHTAALQRTLFCTQKSNRFIFHTWDVWMQTSSQMIQHRLRVIQQSTGHIKCAKQHNMHAEHFSGNNDILLIILEWITAVLKAVCESKV